MEPKDAALAAALTQAMQDTKDPSALRSLAQGLSAILSAVPPAEIPSRSATAASAVAFPTGTGHPLTALALLIPAAEPLPCRLSTQQLVELLKMPTCVGEARRVVLDHLGNRYQRPFADPWEFVRFAKEQRLDLDFTSPPQRPEAGRSPLTPRRAAVMGRQPTLTIEGGRWPLAACGEMGGFRPAAGIAAGKQDVTGEHRRGQAARTDLGGPSFARRERKPFLRLWSPDNLIE